MTTPNYEARRLAKIERDRITAMWKAQINRPHSDIISKRAARSQSSKADFGFHKGVYVSRRGFSVHGTPPEKNKSLE